MKTLMVSFFLVLLFLTVPAMAADLSLTLEEAFQLAEKNDPTLQSSSLDIEEGDATVREAYSAALPVVSLNGVAGRYVIAPTMNVPAFGGRIRFQPVNDITGQLSLDQPIWLGGRVGLALDAARTYRKIAREGYAAQRSRLRSDIIREYYGLALARQAVEVLAETYQQAERHSKTAGELFAVGMASEFDLLRAQTAVKSLEPELSRARMGVDIAETALRNRLGVSHENRIVLRDNLEKPELQTRLGLNEAVASASSVRSEFKMMDLNLQLRDIALKAEKRSIYWPNFFFNVTYMMQASEDHILEVSPPKWTKQLRYQFVMNIPLFDGFATPSRVQKARIAIRRAELQKLQLEQGVRLEVTAALAELKRAEEQVASSKAAVELAQKANEIAIVRYDQGLGTELEVQDARLVANSARLGLLQGLYDLKVAQAEYNRIVKGEGTLGE